MTIEFIEQRIREQEEYIKSLAHQMLSGKIDRNRKIELVKSAQGQMEYFRNKLNETPTIKGYKKSFKDFVDQTLAPVFFEEKKAAYAKEFEGIMKASTTIIH